MTTAVDEAASEDYLSLCAICASMWVRPEHVVCARCDETLPRKSQRARERRQLDRRIAWANLVRWAETLR